MSKDSPVAIGSRTFKSSKTAKTYFHVMLHRYAVGDRVRDVDAAELRDLIARHPRAAELASAEHFEVATSPLGSRCFRLLRPDGSTDMFTAAECIDHRPRDVHAEVVKALRIAIEPDVERARSAYLRKQQDDEGFVRCAVTGNRIMPADGEMVHLPPRTFESIVSGFLSERGERAEELELAGDAERPVLADAELVSAFRAHHTKVARLELVMRHVKLSPGVAKKRAPVRPARPGAPPQRRR